MRHVSSPMRALLLFVLCASAAGCGSTREFLTERNEKDFAALEILDAYISFVSLGAGAIDAVDQAHQREQLRIGTQQAFIKALSEKRDIVARADGYTVLLRFVRMESISPEIAAEYRVEPKAHPLFILWSSSAEDPVQGLTEQRVVSGPELEQAILASPDNAGPSLAVVFVRSILGLE